MTPLPSRLRASAQALRGLSPCSEHSYELLDVVAWNIAAELTEAADALEAGRHSGGSEGLHETGFHAWAETQGFTGTEVHAAADAWLEAWNRAAPAAQVTQESGGVASTTDDLLETLEDMARQHCHTSAKGETDSGALSTNAQVLRLLAKAGRFRIDREAGRMVVGYWPENDPERTPGVATDQPNREDGRV